jgi:hypothetical protein
MVLVDYIGIFLHVAILLATYYFRYMYTIEWFLFVHNLKRIVNFWHLLINRGETTQGANGIRGEMTRYHIYHLKSFFLDSNNK